LPTLKSLSPRDLAQTVTFTALYTVFSFVKISPIIGLPGQTITAAAIVAPIIGIVIGAYLGTLATFLGGAVGLTLGALPQPSFVSGIVTAFFAGMHHKGRRVVCISIYVALLLAFSFYPTVGPAWLYPPLLWFQVLGLVTLISLQPTATRNLDANANSKLLYAFFVASLISTMAGQIAGSLIFEVISWPTLTPDVNSWRATWQVLTFLYPTERLIIATFSGLIGASLQRILRSAAPMRLPTS
jgi:hypothetical protein